MKIPMFRGLIAAPFTPMHKDGEVNYTLIDKYVDVLLEQGVNNVFVNGTTGEGPSLTVEERKKIAEKWIESGRGKLDHVIIQVGTACLRESQELARHAAASGADAMACLPPYFFKPSSIKNLVDYLEEVAKAGPDLPLLYYHIPCTTGVEFPMYHLINEAAERIPRFAGMKFTSFDLVDLGRCVDKFGDKYNLCYSKDEQFAMGLMLGVKSGVGSTYNYAGKVYRRIYEAAGKGDFTAATADQILMQKMVGVFFDHGFDVGVNKAIMEAVTGLPVGPPRLPLTEPSKKDIEEIMEGLKAIDFFDKRK